MFCSRDAVSNESSRGPEISFPKHAPREWDRRVSIESARFTELYFCVTSSYRSVHDVALVGEIFVKRGLRESRKQTEARDIWQIDSTVDGRSTFHRVWRKHAPRFIVNVVAAVYRTLIEYTRMHLQTPETIKYREKSGRPLQPSLWRLQHSRTRNGTST